MAVSFTLFSGETCSTLELQNLLDPPIEPADKNLTAVATDWMDPAKVIQCKIDGRAIGDVWGYRVVSAPFGMAPSEGNLINGEAGSARAVSDGVYEFYGYELQLHPRYQIRDHREVNRLGVVPRMRRF